MTGDRPRTLIVGAGPTGLSLAIMLRLRGHAPEVVERRPGPTPYPAAHVVNTRSQEVFAELGIADRVHETGDPTALYSTVVWCESLTGTEYGTLRIPHPGTGEDGPFSPFVAVNAPQTRIEAILRARLAELGGEVAYGCEAVAVEAGDAETPATVTLREDGATRAVEYDLVVGCDGAGSATRRSIGVTMEGPRTIARFMTIYFEADLDALVAHRPALLYWIGGPEVRGVFICFDRPVRTWGLHVPIGDLPMDAFGTEDALALVRKAIGGGDARVDLFGLTEWNMSAQVADRYRRGRVVLAGDACHRFPPTGGLGMNTGIQDAHNLAWKIDAVLGGTAPFDLLDTYEAERRPVAIANTGQSVRNLERMGMIDDALGVPTLAPIAVTAPRGPYAPHAPEVLGLAGPTEAAARKRQAVQAAIDDQGEHFGQGAGLDLGFVYASAAITPDGPEAARPAGDAAFRPDGRPGARLPFLSADGRYEGSTLAQVARDGVTLFTAGADWTAVAEAASRRTGVPVAVVRLDVPPATARWRRQLGIGDRGAVAVRPDGHVFWRVADRPARAEDVLAEAVDRALMRPASVPVGGES